MKQQRSQVKHNWLPSFHFISFCLVFFFFTNISSLVWPQFIFFFFSKVSWLYCCWKVQCHHIWGAEAVANALFLTHSNLSFVPLILVPPRLNKVKEKEKTSNNNYNNNNRYKDTSFTIETIFSCNENNKNFSVCNY